MSLRTSTLTPVKQSPRTLPPPPGTILSYAKDSKAADHDTRVADFNHFTIFSLANTLACHDFRYIDLKVRRAGVSRACTLLDSPVPRQPPQEQGR